jgi:hypothetical protein
MLIPKFILSKQFIRLKVLIIIISIFLEIYYRYLIVPEYNHLGFKLDFNILKYSISKIGFIFLLYLSFIMYNKNKFLYSIYLLLLFFFYIPNAILFSYANGNFGPFLANLFFVATFVLSAFVCIKLPSFVVPEKYSNILLLLASLFFIIPIILTFKTDIYLKTLLLKNIYETRELFSLKATGTLNYFYHFAVKTILPVGLIFFMIRKKPLFILLYFTILIYLFVISGNKFVYFTAIILLYFYYVGKDYVSKISYFFLFTILLFLLFPVIDYGIIRSGKLVFSGTFVNRFLFIPALLTQWYFDFFDGKPFFFAESHFFNRFFSSPYDMPVGFLISKVYLNTTDAYANNGIVSDGFMNLGYFGVGLFSIVFALLFSLFNSMKLHVGYYGLFFSYIYMILSAPLFGCFITGGIVVFIFLGIFVLREKHF